MARLLLLETTRSYHTQQLAKGLRRLGHKVPHRVGLPMWGLARFDAALLSGWGRELAQQPTPDIDLDWLSPTPASAPAPLADYQCEFITDSYWMPPVPLSIEEQQAALENAGVLILNPPDSVRPVMYKSHTAVQLQAAMLPTPSLRPWRAESFRDGPLVLKPDVGWAGWGIEIVTNLAEAKRKVTGCADSWVLQDLVPEAICWRCIATPETVVTCYRKVTEQPQLVASVSLGARREYLAHPEVEALAQATAQTFSGDVFGIDILEEPNGLLSVIDVNVSFGFEADNRTVVDALSSAISDRLSVRSCRAGTAVMDEKFRPIPALTD